MAELLEAQKNGNMVGDSTRLRMEVNELIAHYVPDSLPGHAAWLDWPWKLHRKEGVSKVRRKPRGKGKATPRPKPAAPAMPAAHR